MTKIELANKNLRVLIDPDHGCNLNGLFLKGPGDRWFPVLRSGKDGVGSFVMLPWTNRIKNGRFEFDGRTHQLDSNHDDGTAIHGVGRDHSWAIMDRSPYTARFMLDSRLIEQINFPFAFGAVMRVEVGLDSVEIGLDVTNLGDEPMPAGVGHHPYFMRSLFSVDDELCVKAGVQGHYPCKDQIPSGAMVDDAICAGLRNGGPIGNPGLDDVFGGFDGHAELEWDKSGVRCVMECSESMEHLVMFTPRDSGGGAPLPWVCVEPTTMVNDGFNRSDDPTAGVQILEPGQTLSTTTRFRFEIL